MPSLVLRHGADQEVGTLRFIRQSRDLGSSVAQIRELLSLWQNRKRPSRQVHALAQAHIAERDEKRKDLQAMKATPAHLVQCCHGDDRPHRPTIDTLAQDALAIAPHAHGKTAGLRPGRPARKPAQPGRPSAAAGSCRKSAAPLRRTSRRRSAPMVWQPAKCMGRAWSSDGSRGRAAMPRPWPISMGAV